MLDRQVGGSQVERRQRADLLVDRRATIDARDDPRPEWFHAPPRVNRWEFAHEGLKAIARQLEGAIRRGDVVARLGGDEFAVLMWDIADPQLAERTAARLRLELAQPTSSGPIEISIGASVGTSILSPEMPAAAEAMRLADASLYMDKRKRSGG